MLNLDKVLEKRGKYLLALSGGPDSMALFHLLLERKYEFHVCHVDHGWREESAREALQLAKMCEQYGVPFYLHKMGRVEGNLEDGCRQKRLEFFKEEYERGGFDALLMAHQADDQVETILKRVFEGSSLSHISGMQLESVLHGMRVLRPFIGIFKSEILNYLKGASFFEDPTNKDSKFLRSRMRSEMVPYLEEIFGKGIKENILLLGKRIERCVQYVQRHVDKVFHGPFGYCLPLLKDEQEGEILFRDIFQKEGITLSRGEIQKLFRLNIGKKVVKGQWELIREKEHFFIVKLPAALEFKLSLSHSDCVPSDWRGFWKGEAALFLPRGDGELGVPNLKLKLPNGVELREWYRIHKVPRFLRSWAPVVWVNGQIVGECLTGHFFSRDKPLYANHLLTLKREITRIDP